MYVEGAPVRGRRLHVYGLAGSVRGNIACFSTCTLRVVLYGVGGSTYTGWPALYGEMLPNEKETRSHIPMLRSHPERSEGSSNRNKDSSGGALRMTLA